MDDVLIFGRDQKEHDERLFVALTQIQTAGVTLNPSKCQFNKCQLKYIGHLIDQRGIQADPDKMSAIREMKPPTNVSELSRFMGMVHQLGKFSSNLADLTQPLRKLPSKKSTWMRGPSQVKSFSDIRIEVSKPTILSLYNPQAPTKISVDASFYGIGAVIMQNQESSWTPVAFASLTMRQNASMPRL